MSRSRDVDRINHPWLVAVPLLALATPSCGDDAGIADDTVLSTGFLEDGGTTPPPAGADETGDGSVASPHCLYDPSPGTHGYRYQCAGSIAIDIVVSHPFDDSPETVFFELPFGQDVDGDDYADPLVMACCPEYDTAAPNCDQPHERACFVDLIEQGCKSMVGKIESFAHERFPGLFDGAERQALLKLASHVREHQADCVAAFRDETGIGMTPAECDDEGNSPDYTSMLEDGMWTFDPAGAVQLVEISVAQAEWHGLHPIDSDAGALEVCDSADDNDDVMFLEIDPASGSKIMHLAAGSAEVAGPGVEGIGELGSTSTLVVAPASLENLALHSAGPTMVVAGGWAMPVESFHVRLWSRAPAELEGRSLTVLPGAAHFAVSATALGHHAVQTATNATPIVLTRAVDGWRTASFTIEYGEWSVVVAPARWN